MSKHQQAFTLIELLIVMLIIALLTGLGLMAFGTIQQKSRDSRRKQDLTNIAKALELYYNDWGNYPGSVVDSGQIAGCGETANATCTWGDVWQIDLDTIYMSKLSKDPSDGLQYFYRQEVNGYYLFAHCENEQDPDIAIGGDGNPSTYVNTNCGSADNCNYVIMSSGLTSEPTIN